MNLVLQKIVSKLPPRVKKVLKRVLVSFANRVVSYLSLSDRASLMQAAVPLKEVLASMPTGDRISLFLETTQFCEILAGVSSEWRIQAFLDITPIREVLAHQFIRGEGIEIGALHAPLKTLSAAHVRYVDKFTTEELRRFYPDIPEDEFVQVALTDDGEKLHSLRNESQDFVIANHFIEHCEDPIGAVGNMFRVLKKGGTLYGALPDKKQNPIDKDRPSTQIEHMENDYRHGPSWSMHEHLDEFAKIQRHIDNAADLDERLKSLRNTGQLHYHVFNDIGILDFLRQLNKYFSFEVEVFCRNSDEFIFVLRKT